ncbi:MAG: DUF2892 domain-containing protein [Chitinophagales bacterium]
MKKNMGIADRIFRVLAALIIAILYFSNQITGTTTIVLGLIALIFIATGFVGFCPLYLPFRISTRKKPAHS